MESRSPDLRVPGRKATIRGGVKQRDIQENYQSQCHLPSACEHRSQGLDIQTVEEGAESETALVRGDGTSLDQEQHLETCFDDQ